MSRDPDSSPPPTLSCARHCSGHVLRRGSKVMIHAGSKQEGDAEDQSPTVHCCTGFDHVLYCSGRKRRIGKYRAAAQSLGAMRTTCPQCHEIMTGHEFEAPAEGRAGIVEQRIADPTTDEALARACPELRQVMKASGVVPFPANPVLCAENGPSRLARRHRFADLSVPGLSESQHHDGAPGAPSLR